MNIVRRAYARNILWIFFLILFFVLGLWMGTAYADPSRGQVKSLGSPLTGRRSEYNLRLKLRRAWPATTTTTSTTTTTVPRRVVVVQPLKVAVKVSAAQWHEQCKGWAREAGVLEADLDNAMWLIGRESGCRIDAHNSSGATGIPQALPGSKMASAGADWQTNPVTQLKWMNGYVVSRYGSWSNACAHSRSHGWY